MEIKQDLSELVEKKYNEIENLQDEIRHLEQRMNEINKLIGIDNIIDAETFLERVKNERIENVEETRTIFSPTNPTKPLIKMNYDGKRLEIIIIDITAIQLKQQSSNYIERILLPLLPIKELEKDMEVVVESQNDLGLITRLVIDNLYGVENIEEVFKVFQNLVEQT